MKYSYIRELKNEDRDGMYEWLHDDNVINWFSFDGKSMQMKDVEEFIMKSSNAEQNVNLAIEYDNDYAGTVSLKNINVNNRNAELAIAVRTKYQGKNIAKKALQELFHIAKEKYNLHKIYLNVISNNVRAKSFYEKMGFKYTGTSKDHLFKNNQFIDLDWYEIILED